MKQWLNTPVTYGCMIRVLLVCTFIFFLLISAIDVAFNIGGPHWTTVSATILVVLGIIIGPVGQWLVRLSTSESGTGESSPASPAQSHGITLKQAQAIEKLQKREETLLITSSNKEAGTLIVSTSEDNRGVTVYLLPRGEFLKCKSAEERDNDKQKRIGTITLQRIGIQPLYMTCFRELQPGRYNAWTGWGKDNPKTCEVQIYKGIVSELVLDWKG